MGLHSSPMVLCFDIENQESFDAAINKIVKKYPDLIAAVFLPGNWPVMLSVKHHCDDINILWFYKSPNDCIREYNVVGIVCGSDREFPELDKKVMRCKKLT